MPTDLKKYRHHLDEFDMTDKQKDEFIEALWLVAQTFVDQAFGITPMQQVMDLEEKEDSAKKPRKKRKKTQSRKSKKTENIT